jgi:diguanylate cyclase (GGDEF)-like protein
LLIAAPAAKRLCGGDRGRAGHRMMQFLSPRKMVNTFGLAVAAMIAVAPPAGYFIVNYSSASEVLAFEARLHAAAIGLYVTTHGDIWQSSKLPSELLQLPGEGEQPIRQYLYDGAARPVWQWGSTLAAPAMERRAPIMVGNEIIGSLAIAASLRRILLRTALVAAASALLGLAANFAIRALPLRLLDRTLGTLDETERTLAAQNQRLDAALTNMAQGLCMFDARQRLLVFNQHVAEVFKIPQGKIAVGMHMRELMGLAQAVDQNPQAAEEAQRQFIAEPLRGTTVTTLSDGTTLLITHRPMADGGFVATFEDITERLLAEERMRHLARHDALTDLPNRITFLERLRADLGRLRHAEQLKVLSLDLDHFKNVNDTHGHPFGDLLLRAAAERMRACVRGEDMVARLGGDEFAILQVSSEPPSSVTGLADRLIESIEAPYLLQNQQVAVGASIGIAIAPADGATPDVLMKNADLALSRAKADGGGVYRFFERKMDTRMQARRALEVDLRKAVMAGEFEAYYQPIVDVRTERVTSCEALMRWHHPARGMVSPTEFIPIAEETGLIVPMGEWMLRQATAEAMHWPSHVTVAVNLSPAQFKSRVLVQTVISALAASGLAADRLQLEITEMVLLQETNGAFAVLHQLRELGIKIAMDDFGTGYSSLGYLRSFPFDKIKIDSSFIRDLPHKEDSVAIIRAVVALSSSLGITTIAEGVETREQLDCLMREGCTEVQGFLFAGPKPATEVRALLQSSGKIAGVA